MMTDTGLLFAVIGGLCGVIVGVVSWWCSRISSKIDDLSVHKTTCLQQFADDRENSGEHRRLQSAIQRTASAVARHDAQLQAIRHQMGG